MFPAAKRQKAKASQPPLPSRAAGKGISKRSKGAATSNGDGDDDDDVYSFRRVGSWTYPQQKKQTVVAKAARPSEAENSSSDSELDDVADDQLFAFDTGAEAGPSSLRSDESLASVSGSDTSSSEPSSRSEGESEESEVEASEAESDDEVEAVEADVSAAASLNRQSRDENLASGSSAKRRKPVWTDPSTSSLLIPLVGPNARAPDGSLAGTKRLRKLRVSNEEMELTGKEYERRLRDMYEKLHPRPAWATRMSASVAASLALEDEAGKDSGMPTITNVAGSSLADLLASDSGLVARARRHRSKGKLPSGDLELERLRDANQGIDTELSSAVECLQFHPSARAKILMTASRDRRVRLFHIDENANPLLQTLHVPSLPLTTALFHPLGSSILLSGPRPYLYSYDLQAGRVLRSAPWRAAGGAGQQSEEDYKERDLSMAKFQPLDSGGKARLLAVGGRRGAVHLLDWSTSGGAGGSIVASLRQNSPLAGLDWDHSAGADGRRLISLSTEGTMSLWDVRNAKCEVMKRDVGLFGAQGISLSPDGGWAAVGSDSGIVNLYSEDRFGSSRSSASSSSFDENIECNKSISNLTTASTTMQFNHDGQMLALASRNKKDGLKVVHFPSLTVFANWPTSGTPLGHVSDVAFSSHGSQYMAIGNTRGRVLLYGLKHFSS